MNRKSFFGILIYLSFLFLIYFFYRKGLFDLSGLSFNLPLLILSVLLLWMGFIVSALSWGNALRVHGYRTDWKTALHSHGIQIFTKYIPGKIWTILGRASCIATERGLFKIFSYISLKEQLVYIWTGLLISAVPLLVLDGLKLYTILVLSLFLLLSMVLFNKWLHDLILKIFYRIFRKQLEVPYLNFREIITIVLFCMSYWAIWIIAFYLFAVSLYDTVPPTVGLAFPLGVVLGLLAIIFPGGIGVREGVLTGFMILLGVTEEQSGTISMISRVWFTIGEVLIFLSAFSIKRIIGKNK